MTPRQQLTGFLRRFPPEVGTVARGVLRKLEQRLPGATRFVYNKSNALVVGFGPSDRPSDAVLSIAVYRRWVNLYFLDGAAIEDTGGLLQGSGTRVRFLRLQAADDIDAPGVRALLARATADAEPPYPVRPRGRIVIRQSSAGR